MRDYPGMPWLTQYRERVNGDPELNVIGEWFTTTFTLTFGDNRYALKIDKGKIADIIAAPRLDVRAGFGFRAPIEVCEKFLSPDPPPLFHDFLQCSCGCPSSSWKATLLSPCRMRAPCTA